MYKHVSTITTDAVSRAECSPGVARQGCPVCDPYRYKGRHRRGVSLAKR